MPASQPADELTSLLSLLTFEISDQTGSFFWPWMLPSSELPQLPHAGSILSVTVCILQGEQLWKIIISQVLSVKVKMRTVRITNLLTHCLLVNSQTLGCAQVFTQQLNQANSASTAASKQFVSYIETLCVRWGGREKISFFPCW